MAVCKKHITFAPLLRPKPVIQAEGEMVEWSITTVLKTVVLRGTGGSNPSLSAKNLRNLLIFSGFLSFYKNCSPLLLPLLLLRLFKCRLCLNGQKSLCYSVFGWYSTSYIPEARKTLIVDRTIDLATNQLS